MHVHGIHTTYVLPMAHPLMDSVLHVLCVFRVYGLHFMRTYIYMYVLYVQK